MEARREAVSILLRRAGQLLSEAGHSSTPDTMRRIQTTLETLSTTSDVSNTVQLGRLTEDIGPLGFESIVALAPNIEPVPDDKENREAVLKAAEQTFRGAEERLSEAKGVAEETQRRLRELLLESKRADNAVQEAEKAVENARTQLRELKKF
jgi:chromosome segregation ATPase